MRYLEPERRRCAAHNCTASIDAKYLMCLKHWRLVPAPIQSAVYRAQDAHRDGEVNQAYVLAVRAAIDAVQKTEAKPAQNPTPTQAPLITPTLSPEAKEAARKAARVLVSEGVFGDPAKANRRLWEAIQDQARQDLDGDWTLDQITPEIISAAARDLRKQVHENSQAASALVEAEEQAATGLRRANGSCRSCAAPVAWDRNPTTGKPHPYDLDGTSHFSTCPQAKSWRSKK